MRPVSALALSALLLASTASEGFGQARCGSPDAPLSGSVTSAVGGPVVGADVFLLATLEGAQADTSGCFSIAASFSGRTVVVVRALGYEEFRVTVTLPLQDHFVIVLAPAAIVLPPLTVRAGSYVVSPDERAELTSLDVVTTPGTAADVLRAVQTLAGVQTIGDGASLIVRGGDAAETKVLLDGVRVLAPYRYESATGAAFGAFDPFALDGIFFSAGGFGARHGDALSGVVELTTLGLPERSSADLTASLAALSGRLAIAVSDKVGFRLTATRSHTGLLFDVNGVEDNFTRVPEGTDVSATGTWAYGETGQIKFFAIGQTDRFGVEVTDPSFVGALESDNSTRTLIVSGADVRGRVSPQWSFGYSTRSRGQSFGAFRLHEDDTFLQGRAELAIDLGTRLLARVGAETEYRDSGIKGSFPDDADVRPGAETTVFDSRADARRWAGFVEGEWRPGEKLAVVPGVRLDRSNLAGVSTVDPRLSVAYGIGEGVTATAAWGLYHQVAAPLSYAPTVGIVDLPPMRAQHWVAGLTLAKGDALLRLEGYRKSYRHLVASNRDGGVAGRGVGSARGFDLFAKSGALWGVRGRVSFSYLRATRTDPNTGVLAASPLDVTNTLVLALDRSLGPAWAVSASLREATGRPFTPVVAASFDTSRDIWVPQYGPSYSERIPAFRRVDLSVTRLHSFWPGNVTVFFASLTNLFDRANVSRFQYTPDYSVRTPVDSPFRRTIYVGATMSTPF